MVLIVPYYGVFTKKKLHDVNVATVGGRRHNQQQQIKQKQPHQRNKVDTEYYNRVYGSKLSRHADIDYLKPGGSPWPWYEQAKVQHGDDKLLHKEQLREHKDYQAEYKKQSGENMRIYQETQRVNLEAGREGDVMDAQQKQDGEGNNAANKKKGARNVVGGGGRRKRKRKDIFYENRKESKQFLKP